MENKQIYYTDEYHLIKSHYRNNKTLRSGVKLMNHIDEGLDIMIKRKASLQAMKAYCLHPLLQSDEDFNKNYYFKSIHDCCTIAVILAVEYRRVANSYLSTMSVKDFVGFTNKDIFEMLVADKIQNEKDFSKYHEGTHKRSNELREYFINWFNLISIYQQFLDKNN